MQEIEDEEYGHNQDMKEAMLASKLDLIATEYNHLLSTQLDSQRQYFEVGIRVSDSDTSSHVQWKISCCDLPLLYFEVGIRVSSMR